MKARWAVMSLAILIAPGAVRGQAGGTEADALPPTIPIFPLSDVTLFPHSTQPFHIFEPRYRDMVADALAGDSIIGMVLLRPGFEADYEGNPPVYAVGCAGVIVASEQLPDGRYNIALRAVGKFSILSEDQSRSYRVATVEAIPEEEVGDRQLLAERRRQVERALSETMPGAQLPPASLSDEELIDGLALILPMEPAERLSLLEASGPLERASLLIRIIRGGGSVAL